MHGIFKYHVEPGDVVVAVLDPPRAGVHPSVIRSIRSCEALDHVIFIACAFKSSLPNFVDLSRPTTNKFGGFPFIPIQAIPVDLFPHTEHCELIVELERERADQTSLGQKKVLEDETEIIPAASDQKSVALGDKS